jgi:hypothetical protein
MAGAQRYPSISTCEDDGFREGLNPSTRCPRIEFSNSEDIVEAVIARSDLSDIAHRAKAEATKQSIEPQRNKERMDCFVASAPLRKRFAFVAGNDD